MLTSLIKDQARLGESAEEFQRLEYSLKLNLRLINGRLKDMEVYNFNNNANMDNNDRFQNRTNIECMELVTTANRAQLENVCKGKANGRLNISKSQPLHVKFGTIIESAEQISEDTPYTFLVFRVGIGRSYCYSPSKDDKQPEGGREAGESQVDKWDGVELEQISSPDGFDSIFLEGYNAAKQPDRRLFQMHYLIHSAENVQLAYIIRTRIEVEEFQSSTEDLVCAMCHEPASKYCENDKKYFC
jgi:hypothetical protein